MAGYVLLVLGLLFSVGNPVLGLIVAFIGGFLAFTVGGTELDVEDKQYREYTSYFGMKSGKWRSIAEFPCITVLGKTISYRAYRRGNVELNDKQRVYDICLLNINHRKKLMVKRVTDEPQAMSDAKEIAASLGITVGHYNPVVSDRTRSRRRGNK